MLVWGRVPKICLNSLNIFDNSYLGLQGAVLLLLTVQKSCFTSCNIYWTQTKVEYVQLLYQFPLINLKHINHSWQPIWHLVFWFPGISPRFLKQPINHHILPTQTMHYCDGNPSKLIPPEWTIEFQEITNSTHSPDPSKSRITWVLNSSIVTYWTGSVSKVPWKMLMD